MKATGIVRRIDELGRVVIPKEIRRTLRIRESDPLEIYTGREGEVILKKYSPMGEMIHSAEKMVSVLAKLTGSLAVITDRDQVLAASGVGKKEVEGKPVTTELEVAMEKRLQVINEPGESKQIKITESSMVVTTGQIIYTIISTSDVIGCIVLQGKEHQQFKETDKKLVQAAAEFLGGYLE